jgi:hypothetical protein
LAIIPVLSGYGPAVSCAVTAHADDPVVGVAGVGVGEVGLDAVAEPQPAIAPRGDAARATLIA